MALQDQEKTEDPTPKRREDAKLEGRIPRSPELATSFVLFGSATPLLDWWSIRHETQYTRLFRS